MSRDDTPNPAYPDGLTGILDQMNARRAPLSFADGEALPPLDCDLVTLAKAKVPPAGPKPDKPSGHARKSWDIAKELQGQNALLHLNGLLIAHLRKHSQPPHAAPLFLRLWEEHTNILLREMDLRWKVSSLTTFGDHGVTVAQRSAGLGLATLFGTMKLYESERMFSGRDADRPFPLDGRVNGTLPLEMNAYALLDGGLDVNMIGRLWDEADKDDIIRPLAHDMLERLIDDPRTVLRRLHRLRVRKMRRREKEPAVTDSVDIHLPIPQSVLSKSSEMPSWGVVCTTNAPLLDVARFVAHHLDIGCKQIYLYLDAPDRDVTSLLEHHPQVEVTVCDDDYWSGLKKDRPEEHQLRQSFNATRALKHAENTVDWLGHIDIDEFVLSDTLFNVQLKQVDDQMAALRLAPAEALASPTPGYMPTHFKLRTGGSGAAQALNDAYPTFGSYLRGGFLSHIAGKVFVRTGLKDARLKIHRVRYQNKDVANIATSELAYVGHLHVPDWDSFRTKLEFRKTKGSYRIRPDEPPKSVGRLLHWLEEEEGEDGLRHFFEEMCLDSSDLRARLRRNKLLLKPVFDPDAALERVFGIRLAS